MQVADRQSINFIVIVLIILTVDKISNFNN